MFDFKKKFRDAPEWQQRRFVDTINKIQVDTTEEEKSALLWLAGGEPGTIKSIESLITRIQKQKRSRS